MLLWSIIAFDSNSQEISNQLMENQSEKMAWWQEARFGMFIHWGVYAVPAGEHKGETTTGNSEWIMLHMRIPVSEYQEYATQFNPVNYDPEKWVLAAKNAGMKYIVITSKHHDGFALFDSKVSNWDIADATPYKNDLLKPLVEACRKHDMKIGLYYSQAQDWTHPGGSARVEKKWDPRQEGDMDEYIDNIAIPQVKEILSAYDIDILWWDTCDGMTFERADRLLEVLDQYPDVISNNRLICNKHADIPEGITIPARYTGDFVTAERNIPSTGLDHDYENCQTMQKSWGYNKVDQAWKTPEFLLKNLIENASLGGNFLLNVGPMADGTFPPQVNERLQYIGKWMDTNSESIYGTKANPFTETPWGKCTRKALAENKTRLYLHLYEIPGDGILTISETGLQPSNAFLLSDPGTTLKFSQDNDGVRIPLPEKANDEVVPVVVLDVENSF
jgi:alpha-L-fucosidase